jgi:hypothetical protein
MMVQRLGATAFTGPAANLRRPDDRAAMWALARPLRRFAERKRFARKGPPVNACGSGTFVRLCAPEIFEI